MRQESIEHYNHYWGSLPSSFEPRHLDFLRKYELETERLLMEERLLRQPEAKKIKYQFVHHHYSRAELFAPSSRQEEVKALNYIAKCEKEEGDVFTDFEKQIKSLFASREQMPFMHSFLEYVVLEVRIQHIFICRPAQSMKERIEDWYILHILRNDCRRIWGATPKYHASIFRTEIVDALVEAKMLYNSLHFWKRGRHFKRLQSHLKDKKLLCYAEPIKT